MRNKFLNLLLICTFLGVALHAQSFDFVYNPMYDTTDQTGVRVDMMNGIINSSNDTISLDWQYLESESNIPSGWEVFGLCDNITCYTGDLLDDPHTTNPIAPNDTVLFEARVTPSSNGTAVVKVKVGMTGEQDTAVFILTKIQGTGLSAIAVKDKDISIFPNPLPVGQNLQLYIDKSLQADNAVIYNIIGQNQMAFQVNNGKELNSFNVSSLPSGMYIIKIENQQGHTIASRKFTKQ